MKTLFHIGYHKTASTYLQEIFSKLDAQYVFYDSLQEFNVTPSMFNPEVIEHQLNQHAIHPEQKNIRIISNEALSGHPGGDETINFHDIAVNLKAYSPDAFILIVLRNQLDWLLSMYTYRVCIKGYESQTAEQYIRQRCEGFLNKVCYSDLVSTYQELFENVIVLPMELLRVKPDAFFAPLRSILPIPSSIIQESIPRNVSSKNRAVINTWRPFNFLFRNILDLLIKTTSPQTEYPFPRLRYFFYDLKTALTPLLDKMFWFSKPISLEDIQLSDIYEAVSLDNTRLDQLIPFDLKSLGYPMK